MGKGQQRVPSQREEHIAQALQGKLEDGSVKFILAIRKIVGSRNHRCG
jgi:ribosome-binding factor A